MRDIYTLRAPALSILAEIPRALAADGPRMTVASIRVPARRTSNVTRDSTCIRQADFLRAICSFRHRVRQVNEPNTRTMGFFLRI